MDHITSTTICPRCTKPLDTKDCVLLSATDLMEVIHWDCLRCLNCDRSALFGFCVHFGSVYCVTCSNSMFKPPCAGCGVVIRKSEESAGEAVLAAGNVYHGKCVTCTSCHIQITQKYYVDQFLNIYCPLHPPPSILKTMTTPVPVPPPTLT